MRHLRLGLDIIGVLCLLAASLALGSHYFVSDIELQGVLLVAVFGGIKFGFLALVLARMMDIVRTAMTESDPAKQRVSATEDRRSTSALKF
jgi:hypothetical protein